MERNEIKNIQRRLEEMLKGISDKFGADLCPTFIPAPPELTITFNKYLKEAKSLCPKHEGIQLLDPLDERACKMGQLLRVATALSEFLSEELER